jgi:hypothetical protein
MAAIYDTMYQTFVDYDEVCSAFIQENNCKTILEIDGTGNLAKRFKEHGQDYMGLDYIAKV